MNRGRPFTAMLALCALLVVITVSAMPGHGHDYDGARPCDICHSGHMPCLQPAGEIQLSAEMPVVWHQVQESTDLGLDCDFILRSPRAPPV
jgi:hypothetical protein